MPYCPTCRQEYVAGTLACADCDVFLVPELPPLAEAGYPDERGGIDEGEPESEPVEVWRSRGEIESQVIRSLLESHGIPSMMRGEALRITHGFTMDGLAEVRILVRSGDAEIARKVLAAERPTACPKCGEGCEAGESSCRSCGERLQE